MGKRSKPHKWLAVDMTRYAVLVPSNLTASGRDEIIFRAVHKKDALKLRKAMGGSSLIVGRIYKNGKVKW